MSNKIGNKIRIQQFNLNRLIAYSRRQANQYETRGRYGGYIANSRGFIETLIVP